MCNCSSPPPASEQPYQLPRADFLAVDLDANRENNGLFYTRNGKFDGMDPNPAIELVLAGLLLAGLFLAARFPANPILYVFVAVGIAVFLSVIYNNAQYIP